MGTEDYKRIRKRMRKIRERDEFNVTILWDDERAFWLAEIDWTLFAKKQERYEEDVVAVEAPTVKEVLRQLADEVDV